MRQIEGLGCSRLFPSEHDRTQNDQSGADPTPQIQLFPKEHDSQRNSDDNAELIDRRNLGNLPNLKRTKVADPGEAGASPDRIRKTQVFFPMTIVRCC